MVGGPRLQPHSAVSESVPPCFSFFLQYPGYPSGFERVLHTICAIAELTMRGTPHKLPNSDHEVSHIDGSPPGPPADQFSSPQMRCLPKLERSPMTLTQDVPYSPSEASFRIISPLSEDERSLSPHFPRQLRLTSNSGTKIRSRTNSRIEPLPLTGERRTPTNGFAADSGDVRHGLSSYGKHADKRMSDSAVDIMTIVRESEEASQSIRRAGSNRPTSASYFTDDVAEAHGVYIKHVSGTNGEIPVNSDNSMRSGALLESSHLALRTSRLRQSGAINLGGSPRIVRKRTMSDRTSVSRGTSVSPPAQLDISPRLTSIPFPQSPSNYLARTSPLSDSYNDSPGNAGLSSSMQQPPLIRPRSHKRWNSEVHRGPLIAGRAGFDSDQPRRARQSYAAPHSPPGKAGLQAPRMKSEDRATSAENSRQKLVVQEIGKEATTYVRWSLNSKSEIRLIS